MHFYLHVCYVLHTSHPRFPCVYLFSLRTKNYKISDGVNLEDISENFLGVKTRTSSSTVIITLQPSYTDEAGGYKFFPLFPS